MYKLYRKSELWFSLAMILIYSLLQSLALEVNELINDLFGIRYVGSAVINLLIVIILYSFIRKNELRKYYGFTGLMVSARSMLFFFPMAVIASINLWNGMAINMGFADSVSYLIYMLCIGFLEEILFRGFLFRAIAVENIKQAILISSLTFGAGHLLNLINGSGMSVVPNICQVVGAIAVGFMFAFVLVQGGSIIPCIITHSAIDMLSLFSNEEGLTDVKRILFGIARILIVAIYVLIICRTDKGIKNQHTYTELSE